MIPQIFCNPSEFQLVSEFGTNHAYNFDPFNEMDPEDMDEKYLASYSRQIFEAIDETDPKAIWIIQNWFMVHSAPVWTLPRIKAFFSGIPIVSNFDPSIF